MRAIDSGALAVLQSQHFDIHALVEIRNVDETWVDVTDRFIAADLTVDVDQDTWSAVLTFARDTEANDASLSPLRSDSTVNVDDSDVYAPLLTAGNRFRVSVACVTSGATPITADYHELLTGIIDKPSFAAAQMTVEGRDLGGRLVDTTISEERTYGDEDDPVPVADVAQQVLDDTLGAGDETLTVVDPSDYVVTAYTPLNIPLMESMKALAIKAGGLVTRYRYGDDGVMRLSMYDPVRDKVDPDVTLAPDRYIEIPLAALDISNLRNVIRGEFIDPVTGELTRITPDVVDTDSVAAFGPRFMQLGADLFEGMTGDEVLLVLEAARDDLSTPKFDHQVERLLFWPAELGDLILWAANDVHYNDDQPLAVVGLQHHLERASGRTRFLCRGKPAGGYIDWIRRQGLGPQGPQIPPAPALEFLVAEGTQNGGTSDTVDGALWIGYRMPKGVDEIRIHQLLGDGANLGVPNIDATTLGPIIRRPEGDIGADDEYASMAIDSTDEGFWKRILMIGVRGGLTSKPVIPAAVQAIDPSPAPVDGTVASLDVARDADTNTVTVTPGTLEATLGVNYVCIIRNKHILPPIPIGTSTSPVVFVDSGLEPSAAAAYAYEAFIANIGDTWCVTGPKRLTIVEGPTTSAPVFANGTPVAAIVSGVPKVQIDWTASTPGAGAVRVEASVDGTNWRVVGQDALASGTIYDSQTGPKLYRLVAIVVLTGAVVATSPTKWYTGLPGSLSNPGALPMFTNGTPKLDFFASFPTPDIRLRWSWTCATPNASQIAVQRSDDNGATDPWTDVPSAVSASVASGTLWAQDSALNFVDTYYRLQARTLLGGVIVNSAGTHYVPVPT